MEIKRVWAMPNKWTFKIKPIKELLDKYVGNFGLNWIDPFAGMYSPAHITNDLNPKRNTTYHLDALDFCKQLEGYYDGVIFDPPYSSEQIKRMYESVGRKVTMNDTNANYYARVIREIVPHIKLGGYAIRCGWNSNGFGKKYKFEMIEILLVAHGGAHNDTICTVEKKLNTTLPLNFGGKNE